MEDSWWAYHWSALIKQADVLLQYNEVNSICYVTGDWLSLHIDISMIRE